MEYFSFVTSFVSSKYFQVHSVDYNEGTSILPTYHEKSTQVRCNDFDFNRYNCLQFNTTKPVSPKMNSHKIHPIMEPSSEPILMENVYCDIV